MDLAPVQLHSERHGRARRLSNGDLALLVWRKVARARKHHWLFKGSLQAFQDLSPHRQAPRIDDAEEFFTSRLKVSGIAFYVLEYDEPPPACTNNLDLLLDIVVLLYAEVVSQPFLVHPPECLDIEGFDREAGKELFRTEVNEALALADPPLELRAGGQIIELQDQHDGLYEALSSDVEPELSNPVEHAIGLFLRRGATVEDKRAAVKQLADALEHLRPEVDEQLLSKDERDLFRTANEFAIRHNKPDQKRDYDKAVWLDWLFHVYLATIRAVVAVRDRRPDAGEVAG
jgi:hypothetical protein